MHARRLVRLLALTLALLVATAAADTARAQDTEAWFEIPELNVGLPPPADHVDRRTAYHAMATFIDTLAENRDVSAAQVLNLDVVPEQQQLVRGPELARKLGEVLDRKVIVPWRKLLDRPDNLDADAGTNTAAAGQARRSILIAYIDGPRREVEIRMNRVKTPEGDPVWVFSRETVSLIEPLYQMHGPTRLEEMMPDILRRDSIMGLAWWELLALPLLLLVAWLAGKLSYRMFSWRSEKANHPWAELALDAMRWPSVIVVVSTVLLFATQWLLVFSGPISAIFNPLVVVGYVVAVVMFLLKVIDTAMRQFVTFDMGELSSHDQADNRTLATAMSAARRVIVILATVVSAGFILSAARLSSMLGLSLLASAGAVTLILGFAARRVLGNILASLQIMLNRSARIGDQISFEDQWCTVERIHFTYVQLKVWNGDRLVVPVERFISEHFRSYTLADSAQDRTVRITLSHLADMDAVREAFERIVRGQEGVTDPDEAKMLLVEHDAFGPVARFQFPVSNPNDGWDTECAIREELMTALQSIQDSTGRPTLPRAAFDQPDG
ncbi:mechanosensitive ion channel family protein [Oceaniglobus roseus]|uniref:mechanosensitive ion channel family protein n=1 Tax=Oceaniglobus roseus TaxID=1737570 RepID=UPI000C7F3682|nr:mechanosensitive ion channel family protein [Kandeliimicrobium roseum]